MLGNELEDVFVVSLEQAVAAPYCGMLLADAGARVVKIERPDGDFARGYDAGAAGQSTIFAWLNRGKQSVCLNLKDLEDLIIMRNMLKKADIFLSNLAPGAVMRLGLEGENLRKINPGIITCKISGYGDFGLAAQKKAYDFLVQGEVGLCSVTGTEETPSRVGVSITDLSTGLTAFSGILRALLSRGKNGRGTDLNISMFDVLADWMNMPLLAHRYMGGAPGRTGLQHSFIAPYGAFNCKGGKKVLLSIQNNREWASFCQKVLRRGDLIKDKRFCNNPERFENRIFLDQIVNGTFSQMERGEVIEKLDNAKIANAKLSSIADLSDHSFLKNSLARVGETNISMAALPLGNKFDRPTQVPSLGEHSDLLRSEFSS